MPAGRSATLSATKMAEPPAAFCPTRWINATASLMPLKDLALVAQAKPGFGGLTVDWISDELDLGADTSARRCRLRRMIMTDREPGARLGRHRQRPPRPSRGA